MSRQPIAVIREVMQGYADRGVFRAYREAESKNGKVEFHFQWFPIVAEPFRLIYTDKTQTLTFKDLLKEMPARSDLYAELRRFVKDCCSQDLLEHRRIDDDKAEVKCANRQGNVSLTLMVKGNEVEYGARKIVHLVNDLFMDHLHESTYYEYTQEHFDLPEE